MEKTEATKKVYYTATRINFMSVQLHPRSLIASSIDPGPPWEVYQPEKHGIGYFSLDVDARREQMNRNDRDR
jgi:hypothetical protein